MIVYFALGHSMQGGGIKVITADRILHDVLSTKSRELGIESYLKTIYVSPHEIEPSIVSTLVRDP